MKEIHLINKQIIIDIMDKIEEEFDVDNIKEDSTDAFIYLWDELKEAMYGNKPIIKLDEDKNSDIIKMSNDEQSYGGTDAE
jgi:hypothetical protein